MPQNETTSLTPAEETRFQAWATRNKITDVDDPQSHYDYRGYWKEYGDKSIRFGVDHFTDTYKQHGHPTFSVESKYSRGPNDGGSWKGDTFIPPTVMAGTLAQKIKAKYPGVYDDIPDTELERRVTTKYPGVYDDIPKTGEGGESAAPAAPARTWGDTAKDVAAGFAKGAGRTVHAVADELPHLFGAAGLGDYIDLATGRPKGTTEQNAVSGLQATNTPQTVGGLVEGAAELAMPIGKAAEAVPTTAKAGATFREVMGAAKNIPVDVNAPGQVALRIQQLADRGSSMPQTVRKFLNYVTDPQQPPMTYEVARDFASNISRLSANEYQRLTPVVAREVANLRVTLNRAVADAASKAGKGAEYAKAMNEYARAMKLRGVIDSMVEGAKRTAPYATAAGAGYWLTQKARELIGE